MKLAQLEHIVAIAERGSLRAAARQLNLAQPALTRSIRELEREFGVALFERHARGVVPTPTGQLLLRRATVILKETRQAQEEIAQAKGGVAGTLTAALSIVPHISLLPKVLPRFRRRYPDVRTRIIEAAYPTIERELVAGEIDFYAGPSPGAGLAPGLTTELLFENTRVVLARRGHPLQRARSLRDLVDAEWVTTSITHSAEEEFRELFERHGVPAPKLVMQAQLALSMMTVLAASDLLALLPVQWAQFAITRPLLRPIGVREPMPAPPVILARRAALPLTPAAEHFCDLLRHAAGNQRGGGRSR